MNQLIYKIMSAREWRLMQELGSFQGSEVDLKDGYIHFSTADQVAETAAKHFSCQQDLVLVEVDILGLDAELRWEPSRNGQLFPHLYGNLTLPAVTEAAELKLGKDGRHVFPTQLG